MASLIFNRWKGRSAGAGTRWTDGGFIVALCSTTFTPNADMDTLADLTNELAGGTYSRKTIANPTVTIDDTNDRGVYSGDAVTWSALTATGTPTIGWAIIAEPGANDASRYLVAALDVTDTPAAGDDVILTPGSTGYLIGS